MPALMSVSHTEAQVRDRTKTETRRLGWRKLKPGDRLTLCRKVMGRRRRCPAYCAEGGALGGPPCRECGGPGSRGYITEPLVRIVDVEVLSVHREQLSAIDADGVRAEGFPDWSPGRFVSFFCDTFRATHDTEVTVIRWRYLG